MTLDNLKRGSFIVVTDVESPTLEIDGPFGMQYAVNPKERVTPPVDGIPLKVLAISPPFMAVEHPLLPNAMCIDLRLCKFRKVSKAYLSAIEKSFASVNDGQSMFPESQTPARVIANSTRGDCPVCGERMIERLLAPGRWGLVCRQCGFVGCKP